MGSEPVDLTMDFDPAEPVENPMGHASDGHGSETDAATRHLRNIVKDNIARIEACSVILQSYSSLIMKSPYSELINDDIDTEAINQVSMAPCHVHFLFEFDSMCFGVLFV
jgi:hypothetical protein